MTSRRPEHLRTGAVTAGVVAAAVAGTFGVVTIAQHQTTVTTASTASTSSTSSDTSSGSTGDAAPAVSSGSGSSQATTQGS